MVRSVGLLGILVLAACSAAKDPDPVPEPTIVRGDPVDQPLRGADAQTIERFNDGDGLFDLPMTEGDGLGPLYIRQACSSCHTEATRGPGLVQKMVVVEADGITTAQDQSLLPFGHTVRPYVAAGAKTPLTAPTDARVKVSIRLGPPLLGRGYMEAILDSEIERVAAEQAQRGDAIKGRIHRVSYLSEPNPESAFHAHKKGDTNLIGRFGLKGRIATIDEFTADAFQGDMGITTPIRPTELLNPDNALDDKRSGVDLDLEVVNAVADYLRLVEIPTRAGLTERGKQLFADVKCAACHVPSLRTRADYPIKLLAGIDAPIFTDVLLHDMGDTLADGVREGAARSRDWRTPPLVGIRFLKGLLHDGRAKSVSEAIRLHGGEAKESADLFGALSAADQQELVRYVGAL